MQIKGNAVIGQSGGPTSAINATLAGVISGCLAADIPEIYGMKNGIEGLLSGEVYNLREYFTSENCENLKKLSLTPAAALGSCRKKITDDGMIKQLYEVFEKLDIRFFFYIGGNDSMDAVSKLEKYAKENPDARKVHFIGVPKTIDNDLTETDHTPGFGSAAKYIASVMQEIMRDCAAYKTKAVTVVEIMGRDAGWLTASAALTKKITGTGPSFIYLPERSFSEDCFIASLKKEFEKGDKPYIVVAVSEGLRDEKGNYVAEAAMSGAVDSFGHKYLSGTGKYLENLIRDRIGCKVRSVEVNILQRCASHLSSKTDIDESLLVGRRAVEIALSGESGKMAAFIRHTDKDGNYSVTVEGKDVNVIANKIKKVPDSYITAEGNGITDEGIAYLMPLISGECDIVYKNGIPEHFDF